MSNNQLNLEKWTTLLEPGPQDSKKPAAPRVGIEEQPAEPPPTQEAEVFSIGQITGLIKSQLEKQFQIVWLRGEISNFTAHSSGHYYFSLKDSEAQISAVMFKGHNARLKFKPTNGMEVIVRGRITVYPSRGNYQITCETMEPVGAGALQKAFEQLKAKLQAEGLFDVKYKKTIPLLPRHIGVVTSPTGAAIQDILNVLGRRFRSAKITLLPAKVQGEGSAQEVVRAIEMANSVKGFDVLIVGRGGGSIEDLWCFNEEIVARAIFASELPIISAVGHEIDFTIADFVADLRAPTPSAAAEIVAKSASELVEKIQHLQTRLRKQIQIILGQKLSLLNQLQAKLKDPQKRLEELSVRCDDLVQRMQMALKNRLQNKKMKVYLLREKLRNPQSVLNLKRQVLESFGKTLAKEMQSQLESARERLAASMNLMDSLSPLRVIQRGYAVVFSENEIVREARQVKKDQELFVELANSALRVRVIEEKDSQFGKDETWISKKN